MIIDPIISKNVALIKDANGKDIERIYDRSGNLVFKNWNTLEGPFPIGCFTSSNKLRNYRIYGNTIQDGTPEPENPVEVQGCGEQTENLFDKDTAVVYHAYITRGGKWYYANDSRSIRIRVKPNTQYTLSTEGIYTIFRILEMQSDVVPTEQDGFPQMQSILIVFGENQSHYTFRTSENAKYIVFQSNLSVVNNWLNELMLVEGNSIRSDYIPYGYKIPVTVSGVNLFDASQERLQKVSDSSQKMRYGVLTDILTAGEYTFTYKTDGVELSYRTVIDGVYSDYRTLHPHEVIVLPKNGRIFIYNGSKNATFDDLHQTLLQLVAGSTPLDHYEPYHEPITTSVYVGSEPLHKIGDYADYVDFKRSMVVRRIKKLILTGAEDWSQHSNRKTLFIFYQARDYLHVRANVALCSHFPTLTTVNGWGNIKNSNICTFYYNPNIPNSSVLYVDMSVSSLANFKAFLSGQYEAGTPVTVWYVLAEPEEEVLSLSQKIPTNIGSNTFSCTISPAPSKAMIQYKKK